MFIPIFPHCFVIRVGLLRITIHVGLIIPAAVLAVVMNNSNIIGSLLITYSSQFIRPFFVFRVGLFVLIYHVYNRIHILLFITNVFMYYIMPL